MRTYEDIEKMAAQDYSIGLEAHYRPLASLINVRQYKNVIEVGTAYAGNAFHLLSTTNIETLVCVDPYKYYPAMPGFTCQEEYDTLYLYATKRLEQFKDVSVTFMRMNSMTAFNFYSYPFDLIFLDGSHDYEDVRWECFNYSVLIKPGGVLCGHDWDIFEGVNKAVEEYAAATNKKIHTLPGNIWYINY